MHSGGSWKQVVQTAEEQLLGLRCVMGPCNSPEDKGQAGEENGNGGGLWCVRANKNGAGHSFKTPYEPKISNTAD